MEALDRIALEMSLEVGRGLAMDRVDPVQDDVGVIGDQGPFARVERDQLLLWCNLRAERIAQERLWISAVVVEHVLFFHRDRGLRGSNEREEMRVVMRHDMGFQPSNLAIDRLGQHG